MSGKAVGLLGSIDCVRWYRGMSPVQTKACDGLLFALRDDMEQGSTYRVRHCVSQLGLHPLLESSQIRTIMDMSQGNDLAFLWFLWELAYKQPQTCRKDTKDCYTVNEQLLLSGIAHLDMPTTLRALDALLPPGPQPKKRSTQNHSVQKSGPRQKDFALPYFAPPVRPRPFISKGKLQLPESRLRFPEYSQYSDRMHQIPNETSRWFAQYQLCPAKRIVNKLLTEELNGLSLEPLGSTKMPDPLCETHRFLKRAVETERQAKVNSVSAFLSQFDVPKTEMEVRRKQILQDIEKGTECAADKIRELSRRTLSQVKKICNECVNCRLCSHMVSSPIHSQKKDKDHSVLMGLGVDESPKVQLYDQTKDNLVKVMLMHANEANRCGVGDCQMQDVVLSLEAHNHIDVMHKLKRSTPPMRRSRNRTSQSRKLSPKGRKSVKSPLNEPPHISSEPIQNLSDLIPKCSRTLTSLKRSAAQCPAPDVTFTTRTIDGFQLDYHKIYDLPAFPEERLPWEDDVVDLEDKQPVIERLCIEALDNGKSKGKLKELQRYKSLSPISRAAANCAVDMFRTSADKVKAGEIQIQVKEQQQNNPIDPNNNQQIENLLKAALKVLSGNPHFVLASLTNAHKMPVLLDWVSDRYGKTFSRQEMRDLVKNSFHIYERFYQSERNRRRKALRLKRSLTSLGSAVTYASYNKVRCQSRRRKGEYQARLNDLALEQARLTWMALRGYSHLDGHIKDTFFAYMPATQHDLNRHHVWQPDDYRDMVRLRLRTRS
ncbi:LOW QUALITY PROTEIN: uncharacterized protein LOC128262684 [Drosophila gunungcola]|uniref:LOW QUALITY PROTEIN: uncharacterized protein LOC128262684 n=1 Tax=Drosophila gunungcola TaxID=103775 RepID=UPI0022E81C5C|nr:LOW QUALITY PROTEIN: uncharacterized protein LOC128262684 [Drosophila gunungcola]